ncbi:DUF4383 domain-containing protein [Actinophytocola sp.]|uniref:DUF4383 domain-containing protein n=1 Tax=Actinophytocola sp. TaxID=1872138 RepID=UPI003899EEE0
MTSTISQASRRARTIVLVIGVVYLVLAIVGFATAGWGTFGYEEPVRMLGVFGVSTLLNIIHTFVGLAATVAAVRRVPSVFGTVAMVAFTVLTVFGVVARVFPGSGDPLNLTWWNVGLYALTAVVCGYVFTVRMRTPRQEHQV